MPQYNSTISNTVFATPGGTLSFVPSASLLNVTSSNNATPASLNLNVSSSLPLNIINNTTLNPYIRFTLVSGSNNAPNTDLVIRFFSQSHIQTKYTSSDNKNNPFFVFSESSSLYLTGSSTDNIEFIDINYTSGSNGIVLGGLIHDAITSSTPHKTGLISASKSNTSLLHTTTISYTDIRGEITVTPTVYTGSGAILLGSNIEATYSTSGSGTFNFAEQFVLSKESGSLLIGPTDEITDTSNISFRQGTGSPGFIASGKTDPTLMYFSSSGKIGFGTKDPKADVDISGSIQGEEIITKPTTGRPIRIKDSEIKFYETTQNDPNHADYGDNKERARIKATPGSFNLTFEVSGSSGYTNSVYISQSGKIGFNTDDPQSGFDAIVEEAQFQRPGSRKGLKINNEGNIESFNKDAASAATGSEFILKYSRGSVITQESLASIGISSSSDENAVEVFNALELGKQNSILEILEKGGFNTVPREGDVIGSIRFVAESGSIAGFNDRIAGEAASIQSVIHSVDATGVRGDLVFKVADQTGTSVQRMVIDAGDNHQLSGSLDIGGTSTSAGNITINGAGGNRLASIVRYGGNSYDQKVGRFLLYDDGTQKVQLSAKGKSYITATDDGTHTTGARLGIGTTDPKVELEVIGDISSSGTITGTITGGSF